MSGGVLPEGWTEVTLGGIAAPKGIAGGPFGSSLVSADYSPAGVPVIRGENLNHGKYVGGEFVHVSNEKFRRDLGRNSAVPGDVLFTQRGTLGQVGLLGHEGSDVYVVSQSQMRLRVDTEVADAEYVYYACRTRDFLGQIDDRAIRTGVPHLNLGIFGQLSISIPPLAKQRAIAEVLGALDDKIAANAAVLVAAQALSLAVASRTTSLVPLSTVATHVRTQISPTAMVGERVDHYSLPAFDAGKGPEVHAPSEIKSGKFLVAAPSVLISKLNPRIPRVWEVPAIGERQSLASTEFVVLQPQVISTSLLWALLAQPSVSAGLESQVAGTSGSHQRVKPEAVLGALVGDPETLSTDDRHMAESTIARGRAVELEARGLTATRDALLPALMSGRLTVRDAERVVADAT